MSLVMTACGSIPKLSADETEMVSEYAASLLLKYDSENHSRLVDTTAFFEKYNAAVKNYQDQEKAYYDAVEREAEQRRREAEAQEKANEAYNNDGTGGATVVNADGAGNKTETFSDMPIAEFLGLSDFTINYAGCEIMDAYPKDPGDVGFSLSALHGNTLLVLFFDVTNNSGSDKELDLSYNAISVTYKVSVNGSKYTRIMDTMLPDSLLGYTESFAGNETKKVSLILEVPAGTLVESLSMTITSDKGTLTKELQ